MCKLSLSLSLFLMVRSALFEFRARLLQLKFVEKLKCSRVSEQNLTSSNFVSIELFETQRL